MTGNVWEWCWDPAGAAYPAGPVSDPRGAAAGNYRVARGGSWDEDAWDGRVACRGFATLDYRYRANRFGFRCAISVP
jgi:formylglycine-generating enzyme